MIVVDNGGDLEISNYFLKLTDENKISHYIRNSNNLWFGYARNQGFDICTGDYIAVADNDIIFLPGWLEECIDFLKQTKGKKLFATPLKVDRAHYPTKYYRDPIQLNDGEHLVNTFAGSNCWVMHREDYEQIGGFDNHYIAGTRWCQKYSNMGYAVVIPLIPKALQGGLKKTEYAGYNKKAEINIFKKYINGEQRCLS
jgi:glycosyltransferase involved in cell wall biosynthesis